MAFDSFHHTRPATPEASGLDSARAEAYQGAASAHLEMARANGFPEQSKNPKHGSGNTDTNKDTNTDTNRNQNSNVDTNRDTTTVATNVRTTVVDAGGLAGGLGGIGAERERERGRGGGSCEWGGGLNLLGIVGGQIHGPSKECEEIKERPDILNWTLQANREASETMRAAGESAIQASGENSAPKARILLDVANEQRKNAEVLGAGVAAGLSKVFPEQMKEQNAPGTWTSDILKSSSNQ
ncbi:MAG TPA: hypothetical protein V6C97_07875 [Oculatellaceae cyanobacterium]